MKAMEGHLTKHNILATCDKVWRWTCETFNTASNGIPEADTEEEAPETTVTEKRTPFGDHEPWISNPISLHDSQIDRLMTHSPIYHWPR
jgi:hypothetical protein